MEEQKTNEEPVVVKKKRTFKEFMYVEKPVNRWLILRVALGGAFLGAVLAMMCAFAGGIVI